MKCRPRRSLALLAVALLTLILTLLLVGGEPARAMLQVSPISSPTRPGATLPPTDILDQPTVGPFPTLEPPTSVPLPPTVGPTATPRGFLPAPTIVNPEDLKSLPLAQPPVSGGGASSEPDSVRPTSVPANATARAAVALLNSLWLLCGGALLIAGAVAIILLWRRDRHM